MNRASSVDGDAELGLNISSIIMNRNLSGKQTGYLLTHLSGRNDRIGEVARSMLAEQHPLGNQ